MPTGPIETLREVNGYLRRVFIRLHPQRRRCSTITPQDFTGILDAASCVRHRCGIPGNHAPKSRKSCSNIAATLNS